MHGMGPQLGDWSQRVSVEGSRPPFDEERQSSERKINLGKSREVSIA